MATTASGGARGRDSYRRRNLLPAGLLVLVLAVASVATWTVVLASSTATSQTSCNPSPVPGAGTVEARTALDAQDPAAPGDVRVTVLNGAGQRGAGQLAAVELGELGISEAAEPDNDRLFPAQDLTCVGQIRYGPSGASAARTMSLVVPCAELVRDGRGEETVDLALGSDFRDVAPEQAVTDTLRSLSRQASSDDPPAGPDPAALNELRNTDCSS